MNFQTGLKLLLLSCSFTTNASAINNSMDGNTDEAASSSDALFVRKLLSSEEVGNGVTRYTALPQLNNWNACAAFCATQGLVLATKSQICPNGHLNPPVGGILEGDQWAAIADGSSNNWVQVGPNSKYSNRLCTTQTEYYNRRPSWGIDNAKATNESNYLYCFKTSTPEPTMFPTSIPTSKPTTFSEGIEAAVGDGCKNGIDFVTSFTTDSGGACDKVNFCNGSTSNSIFNPNVENVCIDFTADDACTNFQVVTTFDNVWRMNALSLTSSGMFETDPVKVVMKGSNDMNTWVELFNSLLVFTERKKPKEFYFANNDMFKYYSLTFERNENSSKMHIGHYGLVEVYTKSCSVQFFEGISGKSFGA